MDDHHSPTEIRGSERIEYTYDGPPRFWISPSPASGTSSSAFANCDLAICWGVRSGTTCPPTTRYAKTPPSEVKRLARAGLDSLPHDVDGRHGAKRYPCRRRLAAGGQQRRCGPESPTRRPRVTDVATAPCLHRPRTVALETPALPGTLASDKLENSLVRRLDMGAVPMLLYPDKTAGQSGQIV